MHEFRSEFRPLSFDTLPCICAVRHGRDFFLALKLARESVQNVLNPPANKALNSAAYYIQKDKKIHIFVL